VSVTWLIALPQQRSANIVPWIFATLTAAAFFNPADKIDFERWFDGLAGIGLATLPLRAQRVRILALSDPYLTFEQSARRRKRRDNVPKPVHCQVHVLPMVPAVAPMKWADALARRRA
jgi:hypothetical protein